MILIDFAHLCKRCVYVAVTQAKAKKEKGKYITDDFKGFMLHSILNSLIHTYKNYKQKYGEVILCLEGNSWRKDIYPTYKANRKKNRDKSEINWDEVYPIIDELVSVLKNSLNVKVYQHDNAEADDIIAVLCEKYNKENREVLIVSSDKDFIQLMAYENVSIFDPIKKEQVELYSRDEIDDILLEHIIKGDEVDNIPNIISKEKFSPEFINYLKQNDIFITDPKEFFDLQVSSKLIDNYDIFEKYSSGKNKGKNKDTKYIFKKSILTKNRLQELKQQILNNSLNEWLLKQYKLNKKLIDLSEIPDTIKTEILDKYTNTENKQANKLDMINYLAKYKLNALATHIQIFYRW